MLDFKKKKVDQNFKFIANIPVRNLALETDAPAIAPVPGKRNEPENLVMCAEAVGKVFGLNRQQVMNLTSFNACRLYPQLRRVLF